MKKIIIGLIMTIVMLIAATTIVNAASLTAPKSVEKGKTVTVTLNLDKASERVDLKLTYDATKFTYVEKSAKAAFKLTENATKAGEIKVTGSEPGNATKTVTFTFTAKETVEGAKFEASGLKTESGETLTTSTATVTVAEPQEETKKPTTTDKEEPKKSTSNKKEENKKTESSDKKESTKSDKVDSNGKKITKLPQTGVPYVVLVMAGVAVVGAIVVAKKIK